MYEGALLNITLLLWLEQSSHTRIVQFQRCFQHTKIIITCNILTFEMIFFNTIPLNSKQICVSKVFSVWTHLMISLWSFGILSTEHNCSTRFYDHWQYKKIWIMASSINHRSTNPHLFFFLYASANILQLTFKSLPKF